MYLVPPLIQNNDFNTNGVVGTDTTTTLLAAGVAGSAYRIVGIVVFYNQGVTGITRFAFQGAGATGRIYGASIGAPGAGANSIAYSFPEPGIQLFATEAFTVTHASTVATQAFRTVVYYYVDNV